MILSRRWSNDRSAQGEALITPDQAADIAGRLTADSESGLADVDHTTRFVVATSQDVDLALKLFLALGQNTGEHSAIFDPGIDFHGR